MRRRAFALLLCLLPGLSLGQRQVHMDIQVNGTVVGANDFTRSDEGVIRSVSTLDLGSIKVSSDLNGRIKDGKLTEATVTAHSPGGDIKIVFANKHVEVTKDGKVAGSADWEDSTGYLAGNLHPQMFVSSLVAAEKEIAKNPALKSAVIPAYFVDAGSVIPLKISALQPRSVSIGGKSIPTKQFLIEVGGVTMQIFVDPDGNVAAEDIPQQHIRFVARGYEELFADPIAKFPELSQATFKTKTEKGVHMKTRDGVDLVCDIVRPDDDAKHPAILVRTPYGRGAETTGGTFYASRGYVYVAQDCRGREDSGGTWLPFVHEGEDGYDTIQWIARQAWSDGKVGMIGASYGGYVQWAAAVLHPPALKCIVPQVSPPDAMRNLPYDHGVFFLYGDLWWAKIVAGRHTDFSTLQAPLPHPEKFNTLPLSKVDDAVLGTDLPFFDDWLSRPVISDWKGWDFTYHLRDVKVPALHISGIWDGDEIGTHINWNGMRALGRKDQWIVFGPWVHAFNTTHKLGDVEYGKDAIIDLDSLTLRWFDTFLKGKDVGLSKVPRVKLFVTGANKWVELPDWPAPSMKAKTLFLGKGSLNAAPGKRASETYTYDPAKDGKVPKAFVDLDAKSTTQITKADLNGQPHLLFKSAAFKKDTAIASPFAVKLYFTCSAQNTDFFADIVDIAPDGVIRVVGQPGKIRCSYLKGMDTIQALTPGKVYRADIVPWDFAHEFKKGHRIGLLISSSRFPMFARNLGTIDPVKTATRMVSQKDTILMGANTPSSFSFQILWEK